jgi:hypothetical protein
MTEWTSDELAKIEAADELQLASVRRDGTLRKPVTIWVVRHGDDLKPGETSAQGIQLRYVELGVEIVKAVGNVTAPRSTAA